MVEKKPKKSQNRESEMVKELLKNLPEGRKIYFRIGNIMVEVTKEEALKLLNKTKEVTK